MQLRKMKFRTETLLRIVKIEKNIFDHFEGLDPLEGLRGTYWSLYTGEDTKKISANIFFINQ